MSPAEQHLNSDRSQPDQSIETIYTTVESQRDQTDWLTVVSNLRQINRQLVEEIARLEEALASAKQTLHTHKEANQIHEITILQQQDDLRIAHDRVGALFQQLETSHQIGQRQQTLIETLSQQLEIVQTIVPQIEAEHEELLQKYQQQSQKLTKTEQVAVELHRRLKIAQGDKIGTEISTPIATVPADDAETMPADISSDRTSSPVATQAEIENDPVTNPIAPTADLAELEPTISDSNISTEAIDPAPPLAPLPIEIGEIPDWTPLAPTLLRTKILDPAKPVDPESWRAAIASNDLYNSTSDKLSNFTAPFPTKIEPDTTDSTEPTPTSDPNWPAPTVNRERSIAQTVKIDLPKFPKKQES
jgi:hypothetical protein